MLYTAIRSKTTVDRQHHARDCRRRFLVAKEKRCAQQLVRVHKAIHGRALEDLCTARGGRAVLVEEQGLVLCRNQDAIAGIGICSAKIFF